MIQKTNSISINSQHNDKKEQFNSQLNFNFLYNNLKVLQSSNKRVKIFENFRKKVVVKGILFLQEIHSLIESEK